MTAQAVASNDLEKLSLQDLLDAHTYKDADIRLKLKAIFSDVVDFYHQAIRDPDVAVANKLQALRDMAKIAGIEQQQNLPVTPAGGHQIIFNLGVGATPGAVVDIPATGYTPVIQARPVSSHFSPDAEALPEIPGKPPRVSFPPSADLTEFVEEGVPCIQL